MLNPGRERNPPGFLSLSQLIPQFLPTDTANGTEQSHFPRAGKEKQKRW